MKEPIEYWDEEHGLSRCMIPYVTSGGVELMGIGLAECDPEDEEFKSHLTGGIIAQTRAEIDLIKQINKYEIRPAIAALKHVYCTMTHSKKYNPKSYEAIRLKKEIAHLMDEFDENKQLIKELQAQLKTYIEDKDNFYKKIKNGQK